MQMITSRQNRLLKFLLSKKEYVTLLKIAEYLSVSEKTVQRDLRLLEPWLSEWKITIDKRAGAGVILSSDNITDLLYMDQLLGSEGDDTDGIYDRLDQILPYQPATIFFLAGINDISHDLSIKEVANGIFKIVDEISRQCPNTRLYLQSLLPINEDFHQWKLLEGKTEVIPQVNRIIHKMANERNISYLNLFSLFSISGLHIMRPDLTIDGLHLTEKGYDVWSKKLKEEPL